MKRVVFTAVKFCVDEGGSLWSVVWQTYFTVVVAAPGFSRQRRVAGVSLITTAVSSLTVDPCYFYSIKEGKITTAELLVGPVLFSQSRMGPLPGGSV